MADGAHHEVLLELAFSLGGEPQLPQLLSRTLPRILHRTDCVYVGVVGTDRDHATQMVVPGALESQGQWPAIVEAAAAAIPADAAMGELAVEGEHVYVFRLSGLGLLILGRRRPFEPEFLAEFRRFVAVFARTFVAGVDRQRRRRMESELVELRDRQRALLDNLPFAAWMTDADGGLMLVNEPFAQLAARPVRAAVGRQLADVLAGRLGTAAQEVTAEAVASGTVVDAVCEVGDGATADAAATTMRPLPGTDRTYELDAGPITSRSGRVIGATGHLRDVTDRVRAERAAADRTAFQRLLTELAVDFVNVPLEGLDASIERALAITGSFTSVDRAYLFRFDPDSETFSNTHEWCAPGIEPLIDTLQELPVHALGDWSQRHRRGEVVHLPCVSALPQTSPARAFLAAQGVETLLTVPLQDGTRYLGFVGFDVVGRRRDWSGDEVALLSVLAELFTNAHVRRERDAAMLAARRAAESIEQRLALAFSATRDAIWDHDLAGGRVTLSASWWSQLGEPDGPAECELTTMLDRIHPQDRQRISAAYTRALEGPDATVQFELRLRHRDGSYVPVLSRARILRAGTGRATRVVGSNLDLTDRKREEAAAERQLELESTLASVSARFVGLDAFDAAVDASLADIGTLCGASHVFLLLLDEAGRSVREHRGWGSRPPAGRAVGPPDLAEVPWVVSRLRRGETVHVPDVTALGPEARLERDLLERLGVRSAVHAPLLVGGHLVGVVGMHHHGRTHAWSDTDTYAARAVAEIVAGAVARARSEAELRANEREYRTVLEHLVEVVFRTDMAGRWSYLSPVWEELTGIAVTTALGTDAARAFHPDDRPAVLATGPQGSAATSGVGRVEARLLTASGGVRWVEVVRRPEHDQWGELVGTVGSFNDITERRAYERALVEAKQTAEAANEAKTRFISTVSHELRTPLNGVIGMLELLLGDRRLDGAALAHARAARGSASSLLVLVDDLLDIARIEAGRIQLVDGRVELGPLLEEVRALVAHAAGERGLELRTEVAAGTPAVVRGDVVRLRQILLNLAGNAVKFTERGGVGLSVATTGPTTDGRAPLRFEVTDTGIGIEPEAVAHLFEPFTQADQTTTRRFGGTGLGLAIVRQLTQLMGGEVQVVSTPGAGSSFRLDLVLPVEPADPGSAPAAPETATAASVPTGRVLVVDDNEVNQELARAHLEDLGCDVEVVPDGAAGAASVLTGSFELVLMDCLMPGVDGFEATRRIRRSGGAVSRVPIVALTADPTAEHAQECRAAGMDDVLTKPYGPAELTRILRRWLTTTAVPTS
jgi:PAS domain S-box-containing protein